METLNGIYNQLDNSENKEIKFLEIKRKNCETQTLITYEDFLDNNKIHKNYLSNMDYILFFYKKNPINNNKINYKIKQKKSRKRKDKISIKKKSTKIKKNFFELLNKK
jgi:hypothetical protein